MDELRKLSQRAAEDSRALEVARLAKLGLREIPISGTSLTLVGLVDEGKEPPTMAQRLEMARRLNEVGPRLPHYFQTHVNEKKPAASVAAVVNAAKQGEYDMGSKVKPAMPAGLDPKEIEKAHASNLKEVAEREATAKKEAAKKAKVDELKRKATAAARKKLKGSDVAPKRTAAERKEIDAKEKAKPKQKAVPAKAKAAPPPKKKGGGIGGLCEKLLVEGKANDDILKAVLKEFPGAKTSAASIAWYRSKLRDEGKLPKA